MNDLIKDAKEFLLKNGIRFVADDKRFKEYKFSKRIFLLEDGNIYILLKGKKVKNEKKIKKESGKKEIIEYDEKLKMFNNDKTILVSNTEKEFFEEFPKSSALFNLAGFWFLSPIKSVRGEHGNYSCVVDYKEPVDFHIESKEKQNFVHLHNHFEYSQLDGCFDSNMWISRCKEVGFEALALTDHGTLAGTMDFYLNAKKKNFKSILGYEGYVTADVEEKERKNIFHLTLLAKDNIGWRNLLKINTFAQKNFYYRPRLSYDALEKYGKGLIILTGCPYSEFSKCLATKNYERAIELYQFYCNCSGEENVFMELQIHEYNEEDSKESQYILHKRFFKVKKMLKKRGMNPKVVLTNDCHFILPEDVNVYYAISKINAKGFEKEINKNLDIYLKTRKQLFYSFKHSLLYERGIADEKDFKNWCDVSLKIAESCNVEIPIGQHNLPKYTNFNKKKYENNVFLFDEIIRKGFVNKIIKKIPKERHEEYKERLEKEAKVIRDAKFVDYFLIIWDIIKAAKENGIYVGAARGSVAGSLVAYCMDITDVDPIRFNLLFERFLNETRVSGERAKEADALPDIDMDFESRGRDWVKNYVEKLYGEKNVGSLATFGRLQLRAAIKDIGRTVGGVSYEYLNEITRNIYGQEWSDLVEGIAKYENVEKFIYDFPDVMKVVGRCLSQVRHSSIHPAGYIISPATRIAPDGSIKKAHLDDFVPVKYMEIIDEETKEKKMVCVTEWEGKYVERRGLLKIDILGIKQLDIFKTILESIKKRTGKMIDLNSVNLEDDKVYERFREGDTEGVFQFKSKTQKEYQKMLQPDNFEHLIASNALIRPGAMVVNAHLDYVAIKRGEKEPEYDKGLKIVTKATFGLYIYQEQIMQAMVVGGGMSLAEADVVRTIIKKFDKEKMALYKDKFKAGIKKIHGYDEEGAEYVWKKMEAFSGYGFNRSHSCSYAMIGYWCNWLKVYHPREFWCANLEYADEDDRKDYINRILTTYPDINVDYPDINRSDVRFKLKGDDIVWALSRIKGVGQKASVEIVKARGKEKFTSVQDFFERINKSVVNKRVVEALIFSGAFDCFYAISKNNPEKREQIFIDYYKAKKEKNPDIKTGDKKYFEMMFNSLLGINIFNWDEIVENKKLNGYIPLKDIDMANDGENIIVAGIVTKRKDHLPKNKTEDEDRMGMITLKQNDEEIDLIIWADRWIELKKKIKMDSVIAFRGYKKFDSFRKKIVVYSNKETKIWKL